MKIKEVCERTGLTERTVRFYRQKGLISPRGEWRNGREYSDFSEADVEMLAAIATLRELSFSIDEILTMQRTPGAIPDIVLARREAARKEHEIAENTFAVLERLDAAGVSDVAALASRARDAAAYRPHPAPPPRPEEANESGMGERCHSVPLELMGKWNWGAFLFPVIWGLANHVYQALWCFIPVIGFFYAFHLGSHGNEFAWKHRYWESIAHFKRVQRRFAAWSIGITVALIALNIGAAIASNRAAERAERIYETRLAALDESIKGTPEWQSLAGSRTLWTDALAKEKFDAYPTEQARQEAGILNRDDAFYLEPDAYYRVLHSNYYDFDEGENAAITENGEIVFNDTDKAHAEYSCRILLSNGEVWELAGDADASGTFTGVTAALDAERTARYRAYWASIQRAMEALRDYVARRTAEVISSTLFLETVGTEFEFTEAPSPAYVSYGAVYEGGEVECGGFTAYARAADGTLYYVHVDVNDDPETGALTESPLAIEPVAEEPGV